MPIKALPASRGTATVRLCHDLVSRCCGSRRPLALSLLSGAGAVGSGGQAVAVIGVQQDAQVVELGRGMGMHS